MGLKDLFSGLMGKGGGGASMKAAIPKPVLIEKIRQSELFRDLPAANLDKAFDAMESVSMRSGDVILKEGDEGDYYYLLVSGTAVVSRGGAKVADLTGPAGFGEEALISKAKRNASITLTSDGTVMRLSKDSFDEMVKDPLVEWCSPKEAKDAVAGGAKWLDVRDAGEAEQSHLHGAVGIPLKDIRERAGELSKDATYVCYCQNGRMSSTAAFLLRQRGFKVQVLRGGLQSLQRAGVA